MLGFDVSERTISRWMKMAPKSPDPAKRCLTFGVLYCFFAIGHDRRRILHFNVTKHPTSLWVVQQLRETFPFESAPRFLIFDRDGKYGAEVPAAVLSVNISPMRASFMSPWQNGVVERWVESCRRDLLHHRYERRAA